MTVYHWVSIHTESRQFRVCVHTLKPSHQPEECECTEKSIMILHLSFRFDQGGLQNVMAMIFAINEINNNKNLFSNLTLGYVIHDNCFRMPKSIEKSLNYIEAKSVDEDPCFYQTVVTLAPSSHTVAIARLMGLFYTPQVLHRIKFRYIYNMQYSDMMYNCPTCCG